MINSPLDSDVVMCEIVRPDGVVEVHWQHSHWADVARATLNAVCLDLQIVDPREHTLFDLNTIQSMNEKYKSYPLLQESSLFPNRIYINQSLALNRAYKKHLVDRLTVDHIHEEDIKEAISEVDQLYSVWDYLRDAQCEFYYVRIRREALHVLREKIGTQNFYSGYVPAVIPIRHLHR